MRLTILLLALLAAAFFAPSSTQTPVVSASTQSVLTGDADCNLAVDGLDALGVAQDFAGLDHDLDCIAFADVNCDGLVDLADLLEILLHNAGLPPDAIPGDCPTIGSAAGLPPLKFNLDEAMEIEPEEIAGIDGGPPRRVAGVEDDDGVVHLFVEGELIVVTDSPSALGAFLTKWNATLLFSIDPSVAGLADLPRMHLVKIDPEGIDLEQLADDLRDLHGDAWGQFNVSSEEALELLAAAASEAADGIKVDLNWVSQGADLDQRDVREQGGGPSGWDPNPFTWSYMNQGSNQDIGVADAWRALNTAGKLDNEVGIAILDGGFAPNEDFPADFEMNGPTNVENPASCTGGTPCPWHGTVVTGAAMAVPDNEYGVAGPGGPVARAILAQSPSLDIASILKYVFITLPLTAIPPPDILNISAGFGIPAELCLLLLCTLGDSLTAGVRALGVLVFAAAGNDNTNVDKERCIDLVVKEICYEKTVHIPCELAYVVCVGGLEWDATTKNPASNYGTDSSSTVDIFGPMVQWHTPTPDSPVVRLDSCGTSCASPFVAGVAALIWAANPDYSAGDVEFVLEEFAHTGSGDDKVPRWVDAYESVIYAMGGNEPPDIKIDLPEFLSGPGGQLQYLTALVTDPEDRPFLGDPYNGQPAVQWTSSLDGVIGTGPAPDPIVLSYGKHKITATATDSGGLSIKDSMTLDLVNHPPHVNIVNPLDDAQLFEGVNVNLRGNSSDLNKPTFKLADSEVEWFRAPAASPNSKTSLGNGHEIGVLLTEGQYIITFVGTDDQGASDSDSINVTVLPPPNDFPPDVEITTQPPDGHCPTSGATYTGTADDPEDGPLSGASMVWTTLYNGTETVIGTGTSITVYGYYPPVPGGTPFSVILTATDSASGSNSDTIQMTWFCFA